MRLSLKKASHQCLSPAGVKAHFRPAPAQHTWCSIPGLIAPVTHCRSIRSEIRNSCDIGLPTGAVILLTLVS